MPLVKDIKLVGWFMKPKLPKKCDDCGHYRCVCATIDPANPNPIETTTFDTTDVDKDHECTCDITVLMSTGCKCGGK